VSKFGYWILLLVRILVGEIEEWELVLLVFVENSGYRQLAVCLCFSGCVLLG
jgi:hypothetical protein